MDILRFLVVAVTWGYVESNLLFPLPIVCPSSLTASCPDNKRMHFVLFTRSNPTDGQILDVAAKNISLSNFNADHPTKIIIHGFTETISDETYVDMRAAYLTKGNYNLIMVDWSELARGPIYCYANAATNIPHVGECTAGLIQMLRQRYQVKDMHVIGHSLGAQTLHYVAEHSKFKLKRVTGLDPAGPGFGGAFKNLVSLQRTAAHFVDVVHTNSEGIDTFGRIERMGSVDFYMNNGTNQPGCETLHFGLRQIRCNHQRSVEYFIESINSEVGFYGNQCADLDEFKSGKCSTAQPRSILMGEYASPSSTGVVAVPTGSTSPYALGK